MKRTIALILLTFFAVGNGFAQRWKNERHSVYAGMGIDNFMGDLGGGKKDAAHFFGLRDFKFSDTRPATTIGYRYRIFEPLSVRAHISYELMHGDDAASKNENRKLRNLSFRSNCFEFGANIDYYFIKEKETPRYSFSSLASLRNLSAYIFVGFGGLYYNPKAKIDGDWVALRPLHTEGQGTGYVYSTYMNSNGEEINVLNEDGTNVVVKTEKEYKKLAAVIPIGIGAKYNLGKKWAISLEISNRYTTSDYLDDCKSDYYFNYNDGLYKNSANYVAPSDLTLKAADRHLVRADDGSKIDHTEDYSMGQMKRGDSSYNDAYIVTMISAHYKFTNMSRKAKPKYY